jgi:hypothetical protein
MPDGLYFCGADYGAVSELPGGGRIIKVPHLAIDGEIAT